MDALYLETNSLLEHVQRGLASLERASNADQASQLEGHINKQLELVILQVVFQFNEIVLEEIVFRLVPIATDLMFW